jgi:hypothetical protein
MNSNALFAKEIQSFLVSSSAKYSDEYYEIIIGVKGGKNGQRMRILLIGEVAYSTNK